MMLIHSTWVRSHRVFRESIVPEIFGTFTIAIASSHAETIG